MSRGLAILRAAAAVPVAVAVGTARVLGRLTLDTIARQHQQPSFRAEMRALGRQGREDFLNVVMGGLAGQTREPGAPGTPTPQQTTAALAGRTVHVRDIERG
jgi:hypothetical protein